MQAIERPDLIGPSYKHNNHRVERQSEIEHAISTWTSARSAEEVEAILSEIGVPVGRVCTVREVVEGEHIRARGGVEDVWVPSSKCKHGGNAVGEEGWTMKMPMVAPILEGCNPKTRWAGPDLGAHNKDVLVDHLGFSEEEVMGLVDRGTVGTITSKMTRPAGEKEKVDPQAFEQ